MSAVRPVRIQLSRARGFNLQAYSRSINGLPAVKVDRTTEFGNPYRIGEAVDRKQVRRWGWEFSPHGLKHVCKDDVEAVARFNHCLIWDSAIQDHVREKLGGRNIACWCFLTAACHGDPLLFVANSTREQINEIHRAEDERIFRTAREIGG